MIGIQGETTLDEVTKSPADGELSTTSTNSVQNKVVTKELGYRPVIINAVTSTSATVQVDISKILFSSNQPIFLYGAYRADGDATHEGFCILKMYNNNIYVCKKVGLDRLGNVSIDSSGTTLTIDCGTYMSIMLIGYPKK